MQTWHNLEEVERRSLSKIARGRAPDESFDIAYYKETRSVQLRTLGGL